MIELSQKPALDKVVPISALDVPVPAPGDAGVVLALPLPYRATFYPLGFAVEVLTNEEAVLALVEECWGGFQMRHSVPPLQVRIEVREGGSSECPPAPTLRVQRNLMSIVADAHNHAICDIKHGFSLIWLNYAALRHRRYLYFHFIETAAHILITTSRTTPIHAACVSRFGHGMLLTADSGVGKSTLSYACAKAGWTFTSDDGSFLLHDSDRPRVIGNCRQVRFRPTAKELFSELHGRDLTPRIQGKPSIEIPTAELGLATSEHAAIHSVIFLNRKPSAEAELVRLQRGAAVQRFQDALNQYPHEDFRELQTAALLQLSSVDTYELRYSDLHPAIDLLDRLARSTENQLL